MNTTDRLLGHNPTTHSLEWVEVTTATTYPARRTPGQNLRVDWADPMQMEAAKPFAFIYCHDCASAISDEQADLRTDRELR